MLNKSYRACTNVEFQDLTVCIAVKFKAQISKYNRNLDLHPTMLNIEFVRAKLINDNLFQFHVPNTFGVIAQKQTGTFLLPI